MEGSEGGAENEPLAPCREEGQDEQHDWGFDFGTPRQDTNEQEDQYMPSQLHPAVSLGLQKVSSGLFFSNRSDASSSVADLLSLIDDHSERPSTSPSSNVDLIQSPPGWDASEVLYHDIILQVLAFLDADSLMEFSQTTRRANFECFYFLQLQLQQSLLVLQQHQATVAGSGCILRLARVDERFARQIVQDYVSSNSTLRTLPLSHSLAYMRRLLQRHGFQPPVDRPTSNTLAAAALLITLVGAASYMSGQETGALPNTLFRVGLAGSLMRAAQNNPPRSMRETAEYMARTMQELPSQLLQQLQQSGKASIPSESFMSFPTTMASRLYTVLSSAYENRPNMTRRTKHNRDVSSVNSKDQGNSEDTKHLLSDPYDHLPENGDETPNRHMPSGCVGAYLRAVRRATTKLADTIRQDRRDRFRALSEQEQHTLSLMFIEACASDDSLNTVIDLVQKRQVIDVDGFYVGPDGSPSCALHTAAFHGATQVLEFLCRGIDEHDSTNDGGLADVNIRDDNGWTALHFSAGSNSVEAVRVLARHGAELLLEANNGYTPFHWAQRLSNNDVANELQQLGADQRFLEIGWLRQQPFSVIASRFFSIVPSH